MIAYALLFSCLSWAGASNVRFVDPMIGTRPKHPKDYNYGGMIPSVASPFAMTRWTATTRLNEVSSCPYEYDGETFHGFQGTHQPAVWMGESGHVVMCPGVGSVKTTFADRGLSYSHIDEVSSPQYYKAVLSAPGESAAGSITAELSGVSRAAVMRFSFDAEDASPFVTMQVTTAAIAGEVNVDPATKELFGWNPERQDSVLGPFTAAGFKGYFVARFEEDFADWGVANNSTLCAGCSEGSGLELSAYVVFPKGTRAVTVRVGVSYISIEQARQNLENEVPETTSLEDTAALVENLWAEKLDLIAITNATADESTIFYTAMYHALQVRSPHTVARLSDRTNPEYLAVP